MAKEGSVAPKERINVTFKPATGNVQEEQELPLKLMVLGDFTQRADDRKVEDRKPISIDKNNFCLLYTSPSPRDVEESRMPSSA